MIEAACQGGLRLSAPQYPLERMVDLELTRTTRDRRLYELEGVPPAADASDMRSRTETARLPFSTERLEKVTVRITLDEPGAVEPGLLLFAAFVVRGLAEDAGSAAAAGASTAATGS